MLPDACAAKGLKWAPEISIINETREELTLSLPGQRCRKDEEDVVAEIDSCRRA